MECLNDDAKKQRHNEVSRLCERRRREWKKVSKIFLEMLMEDKTYKVYKTDEEKKLVMKKCVYNWVENNRGKHNSNVRTHKKNKYKWNSITNDFRKILL